MSKKRVDGVYLIKNCTTKMVRVGSAKGVNKRFSNYLAKLRGGTGNKLMQQDFNNYGEQSFDFILLEECNVKDLYKREKYWLEQYADCAMYNKNAIKNLEKKIRRGKEAKNYKEKRSKITSGEKNGNCICLTALEASEILWLKQNTKMKQKDIAEAYEIKPNLVSRIGKDRWLSVEAIKPIWYIEKETDTFGDVTVSTTIINANATNISINLN